MTAAAVILGVCGYAQAREDERSAGVSNREPHQPPPQHQQSPSSVPIGVGSDQTPVDLCLVKCTLAGEQSLLIWNDGHACHQGGGYLIGNLETWRHGPADPTDGRNWAGHRSHTVTMPLRSVRVKRWRNHYFPGLRRNRREIRRSLATLTDRYFGIYMR